ncbi:unnamed protein product [Phyllotreta striolata]|uniref:Uncharacterized protein n=1 Tax=Phyllotreta striolata TaxID=444603 RepID=A0A9P0DR13_PHYSR|nr:unnamed protein product [Phyllotreta striolata]
MSCPNDPANVMDNIKHLVDVLKESFSCTPDCPGKCGAPPEPKKPKEPGGINISDTKNSIKVLFHNQENQSPKHRLKKFQTVVYELPKGDRENGREKSAEQLKSDNQIPNIYLINYNQQMEKSHLLKDVWKKSKSMVHKENDYLPFTTHHPKIYRLENCKSSKSDIYCGEKKAVDTELRASHFIKCTCKKRYGLQDLCDRTGCHGSAQCACNPPCCQPSHRAETVAEKPKSKPRYYKIIAKKPADGAPHAKYLKLVRVRSDNRLPSELKVLQPPKFGLLGDQLQSAFAQTVLTCSPRSSSSKDDGSSKEITSSDGESLFMYMPDLRTHEAKTEFTQTEKLKNFQIYHDYHFASKKTSCSDLCKSDSSSSKNDSIPPDCKRAQRAPTSSSSTETDEALSVPYYRCDKKYKKLLKTYKIRIKSTLVCDKESATSDIPPLKCKSIKLNESQAKKLKNTIKQSATAKRKILAPLIFDSSNDELDTQTNMLYKKLDETVWMESISTSCDNISDARTPRVNRETQSDNENAQLIKTYTITRRGDLNLEREVSTPACSQYESISKSEVTTGQFKLTVDRPFYESTATGLMYCPNCSLVTTSRRHQNASNKEDVTSEDSGNADNNKGDDRIVDLLIKTNYNGNDKANNNDVINMFLSQNLHTLKPLCGYKLAEISKEQHKCSLKPCIKHSNQPLLLPPESEGNKTQNLEDAIIPENEEKSEDEFEEENDRLTEENTKQNEYFAKAAAEEQVDESTGVQTSQTNCQVNYFEVLHDGRRSFFDASVSTSTAVTDLTVLEEDNMGMEVSAKKKKVRFASCPNLNKDAT